MAGYIRLRDKNPDKHEGLGMKAKIIEAKLKALLPGKPDQAQLMLIRSVIPLHIMLEKWRKAYLDGQELHPEYTKVQWQVRNTISQFQASAGAEQRKATVAAKKVRAEDNLDLGDFLDAS